MSNFAFLPEDKKKTYIAGGIIADVMAEDVSNVLFATLIVFVAIRMFWDLRHSES